MGAVDTLTPEVGTQEACFALGIPLKNPELEEDD